MSVVLYSRAGCPLCDRVKAELDSLGVGYRVVDVDTDPQLRKEIGTLVPMVEAGGKLVFDSAMDPSDLAEAIGSVEVR